MDPIVRCTVALLGLAPLAQPASSLMAQILPGEIVYVRQTQVNSLPYFEIRRRVINGSSDAHGGCDR